MSTTLIDHYFDEYMQGKTQLAKALFKENSPLFNEEYLNRFINVGRELNSRGLVTSHGGNLSVTDGDYVWITRRGARLGDLTPEDVVMTNHETLRERERASSELNIHRAIFLGVKEECARRGEPFETCAIIHVLSPQALFRSFIDDEIISLDGECRLVLGKSTPVIKVKGGSEGHNSAELERVFEHIVAGGAKAIVVRGHGTFAAGRTLDDAQRLVTCVEQACSLLNMFDKTGLPIPDPDEL